ncbi:RNA-binding S4 domain-containing protein [Zhongshania aquimaris]|uniref:Heat shock protein 15 n=1 Tax=Zhongshania aquimaris TaxID=2857107 RepID=A0ABS6VTA2_9GAMM|nr:S4 domain-containing protein [Zhongshania aquimaris]MBW2940961.1 RNA-binding protein [Zhongshania aquimaris]
MNKTPQSGIRIDKWLWAARFFKTRSLAKQAIEGGKVQYNGDRCKVSKEVQVGTQLTIRVGFDTKVVDIIALSDQRRGAPEAALLYTETAESIAAREQDAADRKALGSAFAHPERPNKKQRRQIHRFQRITDET